MTASSSRGRDATPTLDTLAGPQIGHLYWDIRAGKLFRLNDVARQLHEDGIPLLGPEPALEYLRTPEGEAVQAKDLPLPTALREGRPMEAALVFCPPGRSPCHLLCSATPLRDEAGQVTAIMATVCRAPAPPNWHSLAGLAHDLRSPLQAVRLILTALEHPALTEAEQAEVLERLRSAVERALQVGSDLLDWCRVPGRGGRRVEAAWMPLQPFLIGTVQEQQPAAAAKGLTLSTDLAASSGWQIYTDRVRLGRVLMNLLVNAVRYTPAGGRVNFSVAWQDEAGDRVLVLGVTDTGAGISAEEQASIFQPFERGQSARGDSSGSGLGLAIVDQLVDELGLRREFSSEHGRGTIFRVLVPQSLLRFAPLLATANAGEPRQ